MAEQQKTTQLHILVCGRSGVGKSSLTNALFGTDLCEVSDPGVSDEVSSVEPCTTAINSVTHKLNGIDIIISDSPGLQDGHLSNEKKYLEAMYNECKDAHIILYCMELHKDRFEPSEATSIRLLTKKFGPKFWERCVLVFTKANLVHVPPRVHQSTVSYHENRFTNFLSRFRSELEKNNVDESIRSNLPVVAAGSYYTNDDPGRYIPLASLECKGKPPEEPTVDFITELWLTCLQALPPDLRAQYFRATAFGSILENGKEPTGEMRTFLQKSAESLENSIRKSDSEPCKIRKSPIDLNVTQAERLREALKEGHGTFITGAALGAVAGVKVGAMIGAPAGPVGAAVGAAVGAGIGGVVGLAVKKFT